jgi:hypothetical protein
MVLDLSRLLTSHPALVGHVIDYPASGALILQSCGHSSPRAITVHNESDEFAATIRWVIEAGASVSAHDLNRLIEDGAEAVALQYVYMLGNWVVKRRLQRTESADWLLERPGGSMALEVSGMRSGRVGQRLQEKVIQVSRCTLPVEKTAVVVVFEEPAIWARQANES